MSRVNTIRLVLTFAFVVAFVFAAIAWVVAWTIASIGNDNDIPPAMAGAMTGGFAFVATMCLLIRDSLRHQKSHLAVQQLLRQRLRLSERDFLEGYAELQKPIALHVRNALAAFFDVSPDQIYPDDDMHRIYQIERVSPDLQFSVVS